VKGRQVPRLLKRVLALAAIAAVLAVVAFVTISPIVQKEASGRRAKAMGDAPVPVVDAPARVADVPVYLSGVGTAKARNTVTVRAQVDGRIMSLKFKDGQDVKKGDVLALIDPSTYQAQLEQAIAKKALDEAQRANAQRDLERYAKLTTLSVAEKTIDTQRALVAQLTAQIKLDEAAIANAKAILDYTTIVSPLDGRTGIRMIDEGNLVRGIDANSGIVMITEVKPIAVVFTLPQQQLAQVNAASARGPVTVEALDADGKSVLDRGTLQVVDNQVDQTTGTVRMKAEFANTNLQLWPGQFVNVRVLTDTLKQVVTIPTPGVQRGPNGTFAYVVQADQRVVLRPITVGLQTETMAVIVKGIDASDRVVTTGFARLKDGARVSVVRGEDQPVAGSEPAKGATPGPSAKSEGREKMRTACAADMQKYCAAVERGKELRACLQANAAQLSEPCKAASSGGQDGGKPREADARKPEGSSTQ
jgi:membrane fusion protein, multidrug efflux system